jgi:hypothetical protein
MAFLAPLFLIALTAVALPVLVHLLQVHKPKTLTFSTLAFFSSLQKKTMRRLAIKRWILLALRVSAIVLLALALMRPFLKPDAVFWSGGPVMYAILIENGPSMTRVDEDGPYFDQAIAAVEALIDQASDDDRFLLQPSFGPFTPTPPLAAADARTVLRSLSVSNAANRAAERWAALSTAVQAEAAGNRAYFWVTDARLTQDAPLQSAPLEGLTVVRIGSQSVSNLQVTDVRIRNTLGGPGKPLFIEADIRNSGSEAVAAGFVSLEQDGRLQSQFPVSLAPSESETVLFEAVPTSDQFNAGILLEGDGYSPDNRYPLSFRIPSRREIALVGDATPMRFLNGALVSAQDVSSTLDIRRYTPDEARNATFESADAIVLHQLVSIPDALRERLAARVQAGAGVVVFPAVNADLTSYNRLFQVLGAGRYTTLGGETAVDRILEGHPVMDGLFQSSESGDIRAPLPDLNRIWRYDPRGTTAGSVILSTSTSDPLFTEHRFGQGLVLVAAIGTDPNWSDFPSNPLFAPFMTRLVMYSASVGGVQTRIIATGDPLDLQIRISARDVRIERDGAVFIPDITRMASGDTRLRYPALEWTPGTYRILAESNESSVSVVPNISDHDLRALSDETLEQGAGVSVVDTMAAVFGREISQFFLLMGLLMLLLESLVARYLTV